MGRRGGGDVITAIVIAAAFYLFVWKNQQFQDWFSKVTQKGGGGTTTTTTPTTKTTKTTTTKGGKKTTTTPTTTGGGGGAAKTGTSIYPKTGKACSCKDGSQSIGCGGKNVHSERTDCSCPTGLINQEATGTIQFAGACGCGDEATIKHWGPSHHSNSDCCWEIGTVNQKGAVGFNMEGPHPDTTMPKPESALGNVGSLQNKQVSIKSIIWKTGGGGHHEVWIDTTNSLSNWKKIAQRDFTSWGKTRKATTPTSPPLLEYRCDCDQAKWTNTTIVEIQPPGAKALSATINGNVEGYGSAKAYMTENHSDIPTVRLANLKKTIW